MKWEDFLRVIEGLQTGERRTWIVGYSGGMDSCVLLQLCVRYRDEVDSEQKIIAAHVNHCLRADEADLDEELCRKTCKDSDVEFFPQKVRVGELAAKEKQGIEETARNVRQNFFAELSTRFAPACVLLAHHADDQIETVLMNLLRGAGMRGAGGMPQKREIDTSKGKLAILRPLLDFTREELNIYASANNLNWREDESNSDRSFTRNRIRHDLAPLIEAIRPGAGGRILSFAKHAQACSTLIRKIARQTVDNSLRKCTDGWLLYPFDGIDKAVLPEVMKIICEEKLGAPAGGETHVETMEELIHNKRTGAVCKLPGVAFARLERDGIFFATDTENPASLHGESCIELPCGTDFLIEECGLKISGKFYEKTTDIPAADKNDPHVEWLNFSAMSAPLTLRRLRPGDRFHPLGAPGSKKVKDFLIDAKITAREKAKTLVLEGGGEILWLWPWRISDPAAIREKRAAALRLSITPK